MFYVALIFIFILGASFGSFIGVITERIHKGKKGIWFGRSMCVWCRKKLSAIDMIPIFNYFYLKGKCRHCKKKIPAHYPGLELFSGLTFATLFLRYPFTGMTGLVVDMNNLLPFAVFSVYAFLLISIFFYDLLYSEIPDMFMFPLIALAFIGSFILGAPGLMSLLIGVGIALCIFGGQYLLSKGTWLGEGDIYLSIAMACIFGWQLFLIALTITYFIGGLTAAFLLLTKKVTQKSRVPFAPFMVLGTFITIFLGDEILNWYLTSVTF